MTGPAPDPPADPLAGVEWPLRTARLTIRRPTPADEEAMWAYRCLPEAGRWTGWAPRDRADWSGILAARLSRFLLVEREGELIGDLMVTVGDGWAQREVAGDGRATQAELGWTLAPAAQGRGFATEAVRELLRLCFEDLGLRRVVANAFAGNEASWRLMERIGMRRETHGVQDSLHRELGWVDGVGYALLAQEWDGAGA